MGASPGMALISLLRGQRGWDRDDRTEVMVTEVVVTVLMEQGDSDMNDGGGDQETDDGAGMMTEGVTGQG